MVRRSFRLSVFGLSLILVSSSASAQLVGFRNVGVGRQADSVQQILENHDRTLVTDLGRYLTEKPDAPDRELAYRFLFDRVIDHDWFETGSDPARRYLLERPEGDSVPLARVVVAMADARAGKFNESVGTFRALVAGLTEAEQAPFALEFGESLAGVALAAGQEAAAREVYLTLRDRYPDDAEVQERASARIARLDLVGKPVADPGGKDLTGASVKLADRRDRWVLVTFGATADGSAQAALESWKALPQSAAKPRPELILVVLDGEKDASEKLATPSTVGLTVVHHGSCGVDWVEPFGLSTLPASYLIAPGGNVAALDPTPNRIATLLGSPTRAAEAPTAPAQRR